MRRTAGVAVALVLAASMAPLPAQAQDPVAEPEVGSCYSELPADGWDFSEIAGSRTSCTEMHRFEVLSVFSLPVMPGTAAQQQTRRRLFALTSCAAEVSSAIGLTSVASHYALEVHTSDEEVKGVCGVVALGNRPGIPVVSVVPYAAADLDKPLCFTDLMEFVACQSRKAASRVYSAALFYPLTSIVDAMAFPGRKASTRRANRIARTLDHPRGYHYFAPRTPKLWRSHVRMVYVYKRR